MASTRVDRILRGLIVAVVIALAIIVVDTLRNKVVEAGDKAPSFSIKADDGRTLTAKNFGGKLLVLHFWASWCAPCVEEFPLLDQFQKQFADSGVVVLAISVDQSDKAYRNFLSRAHPSFVTARDPEGNISARYGTFMYPETYVIDRNGSVVMKMPQSAAWNDPNLQNSIKSLL